MSQQQDPRHDPPQALVYEIRVGGRLDPSWEEWFHGLAVARLECGDTLLTGPVADQAALHGLLSRVRDLGVPLVSVNRAGHGPIHRHHEAEED